jgi:hypothetical protein
VVTWNTAQLRLAAGLDLAYHHGSRPCSTIRSSSGVRPFSDPVFRAPTSDEKLVVARQTGETPGVVVTFEADGGGSEPVSCLIAAERVEIVPGTVFRYWRKDLEPGQRLAPWVHPPA